MKTASGKRKLRDMAEQTLLKIQEECCHLFPYKHDVYPIKCGPAGLCLMRWNAEKVEFEWFDRPLDLLALKNEADL